MRFPPHTVMLALFAATPAMANSFGISGRAERGCTGGGCHNGGTVVPQLELTGPERLAPGETGTYMLMVTGQQPNAAHPQVGCDIQASAGTLVPNDDTLKPMAGELTHNGGPIGFDRGSAMFSFQYTAPADNGSVTLFVAANSVDGDGTTGNDMSAAIQMLLAIDDNPAPLPDSGPEADGGPDASGGADGGYGADAAFEEGDADEDQTGCQTMPSGAPDAVLLALLGVSAVALRRRRSFAG